MNLLYRRPVWCWSVLMVALPFSGLSSKVADAHDGPRIWIGASAGRLVTLSADDDVAPQVYTPSRVFVGELLSNFGLWTAEFPGFEVQRSDASIPSNTSFSFTIAGPLLYFDHSTDQLRPVSVMFGKPGPVPQLAITLDAQGVITANAAVPGFEFFTFSSVGDHAHLQFTLLGNGTLPPADGPAGVYALPLTLAADGYADSEMFYLLLAVGVDLDDPLTEAAMVVAEHDLAPIDASAPALLTVRSRRTHGM